MIEFEKIKEKISKNDGVVKTAELVKLGMTNADVIRLCKRGFLQRVKHGYYQLVKTDEPNEEKIISGLFPDGVICMYTALFYYGYSDRTPLEWTLAFERNVSRSRFKIGYPNIKPYFIDEKYFEIGITKIKINEITIQIYDRERVICDCFKYRNKIEAETFNKAVAAYVQDSKKNLLKLSIYAKQLRVFYKVNDIIGVLI